VHENVERFGGDRDEVTLFGESAGAASVHMHAMSPLSQPYFKRFIMESGSATAPWALEANEAIVERAVLVAKSLNCNLFGAANRSAAAAAQSAAAPVTSGSGALSECVSFSTYKVSHT